ncbi:MAG: hypothetical protein JO057_01285 [Chloroflexi bacterium]|nr:hypothetical protein [Chloroflexota bacterium]
MTNGRYIFGCSGFPNAFFSEQRGLSFENPPRADDGVTGPRPEVLGV